MQSRLVLRQQHHLPVWAACVAAVAPAVSAGFSAAHSLLYEKIELPLNMVNEAARRHVETVPLQSYVG